MMTAMLPGMRAQGRGAIVTVGLFKPSDGLEHEHLEIDGDGRMRRMRLIKTRAPLSYSDYPAELARDLIDVIQAEKKQKPSKASMRTQVFAAGFADIARANEDAALTQLILAQALPPKTAKEELRTILDWVDRLGSLRLEMTYGDNDFRYDILWQAKKK